MKMFFCVGESLPEDKQEGLHVRNLETENRKAYLFLACPL